MLSLPVCQFKIETQYKPKSFLVVFERRGEFRGCLCQNLADVFKIYRLNTQNFCTHLSILYTNKSSFIIF